MPRSGLPYDLIIRDKDFSRATRMDGTEKGAISEVSTEVIALLAVLISHQSLSRE